MAVQKIIVNLLIVVIAALVCIAAVQASPVPDAETVAVPTSDNADTMREGRFYGGVGGAQASAIASANAGGYGMGGYPYGGGLGSANAFAAANANSFGYGK